MFQHYTIYRHFKNSNTNIYQDPNKTRIITTNRCPGCSTISSLFMLTLVFNSLVHLKKWLDPVYVRTRFHRCDNTHFRLVLPLILYKGSHKVSPPDVYIIDILLIQYCEWQQLLLSRIWLLSKSIWSFLKTRDSTGNVKPSDAGR
jgi:hypothetical protein